MPDLHSILVYILAYIGLYVASFYMINMSSKYKKAESLPATDKTVSIVVPAWNEGKSIESTIKSLLATDYPKEKFEIIIVDDGSKDDTYKLAKKYESEQNPKVRVFTKDNGGKGSAINFGIKKSKAEIIISMDADSIVRPDALKKMIGYFKNEQVMSVTPSMGVYKPKKVLEKIQQIEYYIGVFLRKSFAIVNAIHITPGAFSAYRREFFVKYGGYDTSTITEDLEIALRIQSKGYIIENSPESIIYTIAPKTFRELLVQRRRWYTGLIKNLWRYRSLFGLKKGPLGALVLPVAIITIVLSVILTVYMVIKLLIDLRLDLLSLQSINFRFNDAIEINKYLIENIFYKVLSNPLFIITIMLLTLLVFYLYYSRKKMKFSEGLKISFVLFVFTYSLLFTFWWISSAIYVLLNKKVVWRETKW